MSSKERGYVLAATVILPEDLDPYRKLIRSLTMKGQYRIHFKKESEPRRRKIIAELAASGVTATIYDASAHQVELTARDHCLAAVVTDATATGAHMLVIEQDDSLLKWETQRLIEITRDAGCQHTLRYEHKRAATENLLAIRTRSPGAGPKVGSGESASAESSRTFARYRQREARLTNRPDGCRAHFLKLTATG